MKVYKDYFKQILTGLMHIFIEHTDLLRCHTWDFGFVIQVRSTMKHNELNCRNLYTILIFIKLKMKKTSQFAWKKDYILPNFKLQFSHIFPRMSVCQNSDEIKATDPRNIRMSLVVVLFVLFCCFVLLFCFVLFCFVFCFVLFCFVFCFVLFCFL